MPVTPASDLTPSSYLHGHQHTPGISEYVHKNKKIPPELQSLMEFPETVFSSGCFVLPSNHEQ